MQSDNGLLTVKHYINKGLQLVGGSQKKTKPTKYETQIKHSTYKDYCRDGDKWIEAIGEVLIVDLTIGHIRDFLLPLDIGTKRTSNLLRPLNLALNTALEDSVIDRNILVGWKRPTKRKALREDDDDLDPEVDPFNLTEQMELLSVMEPEIRNLYQFAFWSGLRISEYIALKWQDIDFDKGIIKVRRAKTQKDKEVSITKTDGSRRDVLMLSRAREALLNQRQHTQLANKEVFLDPKTGQAFDGDEIPRRRYWCPAFKLTDVRYRTPKQTRHSYASWLLTAGESKSAVAKQMGHTDESMIDKHYHKWIKQEVDTTGDKIEALLAKGV